MLGQSFSQVDKHALLAPPAVVKSVKTLAHFLTHGQPDEIHKARAIYAWITLHITYVDSTDEHELWATPEHLIRQNPEKVLQNRTAVCQGYANLFCALADEAGIPCQVVTGIVKNMEGKIEPVGHAWAAAQLAGEWYLFDPTWGVPPANDPERKVLDMYFMADPTEFLLQHLPDDPVWQLLENPITEKQFRSASDEEILAWMRKRKEETFKFRDTLATWLKMGPLMRLFSSEGRVLRFNSSNERVIFDLGQNYWPFLFDIRRTLDSLTQKAILENDLNYDSVWFEKQLELMERYHARARDLFSKLRTPERIEKANRFYTPKEMAALFDRLRGDMRTGIFEAISNAYPPDLITETVAAQLAFQFARAKEHYDKCEKKINCDKFSSECFNIKHNQSLMSIKLGEAYLQALKKSLTQEKISPTQIRKAGAQIRLARENYLYCIRICQAVLQQKNARYLFMKDRIAIAKKGLLDLHQQEIRIETELLVPELSEILGGKKTPPSQIEKLEAKLLELDKKWDHFKDTLRQLSQELGKDYVNISLFNTELDVFTLRCNMTGLCYLSTLWQYAQAYEQNEVERKKETLKTGLAKAAAHLKKAENSDQYLRQSGFLPQSAAERQKQQILTLKDAIHKLQSGL